MKFYIGVNQYQQLSWVEKHFIYSYQLARRRKHPWMVPDRLNWIMDSGSFSELKMNGKYTFTPQEYFNTIEHWQPDIFVNMDYMCEPNQLEKTGMTVDQHQLLSLENQIQLKELLEDSWMNGHVELMGVIQGWTPLDYEDHIQLLKDHDMIMPYMGIGSVCRRGDTNQILKVIKTVSKQLPNTKLHGFGVKTDILSNPLPHMVLDSVDSQAWCMAGNYGENAEYMKKCLHHEWKRCPKNTEDCRNCGRFMNTWLEKNLNKIDTWSKQTQL